MKNYFFPAMVSLLLFCGTTAFSQQLKFNHVIDRKTKYLGVIFGIAQDRQGYIWISAGQPEGGPGGVYRYDGSKIVSFLNDRKNDNSLANNWAYCMIIDSSGIIWIGTLSSGLDRYDPSTNSFMHFRHDAKKIYSLANDSVRALLEDHKGNLWVGTLGGLDLLDKETGRFTHYANNRNDTGSLSYNHVHVIYEDRQGTLWVGCGSSLDKEPFDSGGLNRFNRTTGTFTRYMHDPADPGSIGNNKVSALLEDNKGIFWVGTAGDGLHTMNRSKGSFTHYYYDPTHPEKLSRPFLDKTDPDDHITFIKEDITGAIWIGSFHQGINRYDPVTKKITHYGLLRYRDSTISAKDTASGFQEFLARNAFTSKDGLFWITSGNGDLYNINLLRTDIPYYNLNTAANSFYKEPGKNILWIGTVKGLIRKNMTTGDEKILHHDPHNNNSLCNDTINCLRVDDEGKFWLATNNGLSKFDPVTNSFTNCYHSEKDTNSLSSNNLINLFIDRDKNVWVGTYHTGLNELDPKTNKFRRFENWSNDINKTNSDWINYISEDENHTLWIGTGNSINSLDKTNMQFRRYWEDNPGNYFVYSYSICVDAKGVVWSGSYDNALSRFDKASDGFLPYEDSASGMTIDHVLNILEDNKHNLWVATSKSITRINEQRNKVKIYRASHEIHFNDADYVPNNFQSWDGELFFGDSSGYYSFFPAKLKDNSVPPLVSFSAFYLGDKEVKPAVNGVLKVPVWQTKEIKLSYGQNIFSIDFNATHYDGEVELQYLFILENYDNTWHHIGTDHTAYFFNVPPGKYIFHAKAIEADGTSDEKTISIIIVPPWYKSWWAYSIYGICFLLIAFIANRIVKNRIVEKERTKSKEKELAQAKEIEKAYHSLEQAHETLKATQAQLIQSEKMASLGELTAGIAHEIQNPLNFMNNFSEVNKELLAEMKDEMRKGNLADAELIANDIEENEEKINHHGKRADSIVKGMLQHSRASSGQKELTDINKLNDEYSRLSYHGMKARDKSFNAEMKTEFDEAIGKINVVPQDIGRVLLNLFNNAFYAVNERRKVEGEGFKAMVSVQTKKIAPLQGMGAKVEIRVADNGNGIPQNIVDKIFHPFFTTKPTGQGTGLGLSLAYDIIKAHGGEIKVETKEGKGSEFVILLPT
jgi:ligand-binding sensor domain-containing protein/signal transduction histidine kinase